MSGKRYLLIAWMLCLLLNLFWFVQTKRSETEQEIQDDFNTLVTSHHIALDELIQEFSDVTEPLDIDLNYPFNFQIFDNGKLVYWTSNDYLPPYFQLESSVNNIIENENGVYLVSKKELKYHEVGKLEFYAFSPIIRQYSIENQFLTTSWNHDIFGELEAVLGGNQVLQLDGETILNYSIVNGSRLSVIQAWGEGIFMALLILTLIWGTIVLKTQLSRSFYIIVLAIGIPIFRLIQLYIWPLEELLISPLFDQTNYVSFWWIPSLGDLAINLVLLYIIVYHITTIVLTDQAFLKRIFTQRISGGISALMAVCLVFLGARLTFGLPLNLIENSQYTLDISASIAYEWIRIFMFGMIILMGAIYFWFNHLSYKIFLRSKGSKTQKFVLFIIVSGLMLMTDPDSSAYIVGIQVALWVVMFLTKSSIQFNRVKYSSLFYLILVSMAISGFSTLAIYKGFERSEQIAKSRFASDVVIVNDVMSEYHLYEMTLRIANDPSIRARFINQFSDRVDLTQQLQAFVPAYLYKYDLKAYQLEVGNSSIDYWEERIESGTLTAYDHIILVPDHNNGRHQYLALIELVSPQETLGYIVLVLKLKKYSSKAVFPSLLVQQSPAGNANYNHAFYENSEFQYGFGNYSFENEITSSVLEKLSTLPNGIEHRGHHLLARKIDDAISVVVISPLYELQSIIANWSFQFILNLAVIGLIFWVITTIYKIESYSLANKIQLYMGLGFVLPVFLVSVAILNALNNSYRDEIDRSYQKRAINLVDNLDEQTERFVANEINRNEFNAKLYEIAAISQSDVMVYDISGKLLGTSRQEVFDRNLLSNRINPRALREIKTQGKRLSVAFESINKLDFKTVYAGIYSDEDGGLIGIMALPFFNSKNHLNRQQIEVFNNLIILLTIVFIITTIVGNVGLKKLVEPIKTIADRLGKTNYFQSEHELINYSAKDEIGLLIHEYNRMVSKLEESKQQLALVQKETAWKEIARQVAHEIKNPLTPMRLKIQQMQRKRDPEDREYASLDSLLNQVDTLSSIADSFSAFAQMPAPQNAEVNLSDLTRNVIRLFRSDDVELKEEIADGLIVYADPKLISQILNNLILNAIQSIETTKKQITVSLTQTIDKVLISISDNGTGISPDIKDEIFKPYFSTKETGSGIGLALAKKGIEQAGGNIWFETNLGEGTSFFITLPVANLSARGV
ncbi:MAG: HAMP domain-containing histidine kinase [Cyclobacteriaceae bacterium]